MSEPTALYRIYDKRDVLVYVGISKRIESRLSAHQREKPWHDVGHITLEWFESRKQAAAAEWGAIAAEHPKWNVAGKSPGKPAHRLEASSLVGDYFHVPKLHSDGCLTILRQGEIVDEVVSGLFRVSHFDWATGARLAGEKLYDLEEMADWYFYDSDEEMRFAFSYYFETKMRHHFERCAPVFD